MYYTEDDMIRQIPAIKVATPFERHACKAMAFGDNLALSVAFVAMAEGLEAVEQKACEANENNNKNVSQEANALAVALMQSLAPVIKEV
jgi:hypothetical protein